MKRSGQIFKRKNGSWWARVVFTDSSGKRHDLQRRGQSKAHAQQRLDKLLSEIDQTDGRIIESERMTFKDLANHYEKHYLIPAEVRDGMKVAGLRSRDTMKTVLNALRDWFDAQPLQSLTYDDLKTFRERRLKTPTKFGHQRALATVHRELAMLRRMFNIALRQGWIVKNPFKLGEPLINSSCEVKRQRVLSSAEEQRLLAACSGRRAHLRPILVILLDTGARCGEVLKLKWKNVDLARQTITFLAETTKTERERVVAMTRRLYQELVELWERSPQDGERQVFGMTTFQWAWEEARREAGLEDVRRHDIRHTCATRWAKRGIPIAEISKLLGHASLETTMRYINPDDESIRRAASALDDLADEKLIEAEKGLRLM